MADRAVILPRTCLLAALALSAALSAEEPDRPIAIQAVCANSTRCDVEGTLTLRSAADPAVAIVQPIANGLATVTLDGRTEEWEIELAAPGFWMPRQPFRPTGQLDVWRTTALTGRFTPPAQATLPKSFEVSAQSTFGARGPAVAEGTVIGCPIAADGSWGCAVPAVPLDLTFRVKGFTPEYRWDVKLQPGTAKSFGTVALRRGASVVAWLDRHTLKQLKSPARARLLRMAMTAPTPVSVKLNEPVAEAVFSERGVVQLAPLPAGSYSLEVSAPGLATATVPHIEVYEGKESTLRHPIRLEPPLTIRIALNPPQDPTGKPWRVTLSRLAEIGVQAAFAGKGEVDPGGLFVAPGQAPGRYHLGVRDSRGDQFASRRITIRTEAEAFITVDLANLRVRGRVTMGDEPVAAKLHFGGRGGAEQVHTTANDDGEFDVVLPYAGEWYVDVREDARKIRAGRKVEVKAETPLEIELPNTEIAGWVIGPDGSRVATAEVAITAQSRALDQDVDANGAFRFRGVTPGKLEISARNMRNGEFSAVTEIEVTEGTLVEGVQLELLALDNFRGSLVSQGQPVVGALITAYGFVGKTAKMRQTVTGLEGEFELTFPTGATSILLIAASPGRTLQAYTLSANDNPVRLDLAPAGGAVRLAWPKGAKRPLLVYNGTDIPMTDLGNWLRAHGRDFGSDIEIPAMAPGPYRFCADKSDGRVCREGLLARGGSLSLTID